MLLVGLSALAAAAALWRFYLPVWRVEQDVKRHLYDPDSAKFSAVTFNRAKSAGCGVVNAKNRMGGYTGDTHFILFPDGELRFGPTEDGGGASLERKIEILDKEIAYAKLVEGYCT